MNEIVANPFGTPATTASSVAASTEAARATQEVQAAVIMAKKFPRDQVRAADRILQACQRYALAEHAVYSYPRGGEQINGPSIRLAEAAAKEWGNMQYGIVEQERRGDESSMLAYAWDLETNVMARAEYKVRHYRDTKAGRKTLTDERDIYEIVANNGARRLRACILKLIPGDVIDAAIQQCDQTIKAQIKDLPTAIQQMVSGFQQYGVTKEMIEKRLRHRLEATNAAEIVAMRRVYTSIHDGMGSPGDYFEQDAAPAVAPTSTAERARAAAARVVQQDTPEQDEQLAAAKTFVEDYIAENTPADVHQLLRAELAGIKTPEAAQKMAARLARIYEPQEA